MGITLGHVACTLFVSRENELEVGRVVEWRRRRVRCTTGVSEDVFDAVPEHHLAAGLAGERVVKVLLLDQRRGLVGDVGMGWEDWC